MLYFSSPKPRGSQGELIVCVSLSSSTISNIFSSETAWPFKVKGEQKLYKLSRSHGQDGRHANMWLLEIRESGVSPGKTEVKQG